MERMPEEYLLIEIVGDELFMRGFLEGYFAGLGVEMTGLYFGSEIGLDDERFVTRLKNFLGLDVEHNLLVIRKALLPRLEEALSRLRVGKNLSLRTVKVLQKIEFPFRVETPSREVAAQLKGLFGSLPEGARLERFHMHEDVVDDAFETSAYAPEHPYRFKASGILTGEIGPTLESYRQLAGFENVVFDEPALTLA